MLTSHSSWEEWFPPGLGGLTYLTSHIFTMVASAPLWGQRSEFQTSWVITDFSANPPPCSPTPHLFLLPPPPDLSHFQVFLAPSLDCSWLIFRSPAVILPNHQFSLPKSPSISYSVIVSFLPSLFLTFTVIFPMMTQCWLVPFGCMSLHPNRVWSVVACPFILMFLQRSAPRPKHSATLPNLYPTHSLTRPYRIYGWQPLLSLKPLNAGRWFISYEWRANLSAFLSHLWEEAADVWWVHVWCLCFTSILHRRIGLKHDWKKTEDEEAKEHRQQKRGPGWWCSENCCGNANMFSSLVGKYWRCFVITLGVSYRCTRYSLPSVCDTQSFPAMESFQHVLNVWCVSYRN